MNNLLSTTYQVPPVIRSYALSVDAFDHLKVDETFWCDFFSEFVFLYDFVGQVVELYADVFWA